MKKIISSLIIPLVLSFLFLAYTETRQQSPDSQNWWVVYFSNPKDESLNFVIENNSDKNNFHYTISLDKDLIKEADIEINKGIRKKIPVTIENSEGKKITIRVSVGADIKEIYKNFGK